MHVVDISNPRHPEQIRTVERILSDLHLDKIPVIRGLNKVDRVPAAFIEQCVERLGGVALCAKDPDSLAPLMHAMASMIEKIPRPAAEEH